MMTIDKAIDCNLSLLEFMKIENMLHPNCVFADDNFEALEMANSALKAQSDKDNNVLSKTDGDCISRKWCLAEYDRQHVGPPGGARKIIVEAPSIFPTFVPGTSEDTISQQAAIDTIMNTDETCYIYWKTYYKDLIEALPSAQPTLNNQINLCDSCKHNYPDCPAGRDDILFGNGKSGDNICACGKYEVERRNTGHWVDAGSGLSMWPWKCSVCGSRQSVISDFCPDCGSKMKSKQFNFCDSCKHSSKRWDEPPCDGCCRAHSAYEPIEGK